MIGKEGRRSDWCNDRREQSVTNAVNNPTYGVRQDGRTRSGSRPRLLPTEAQAGPLWDNVLPSLSLNELGLAK
jgi:hypothetical protein